MKKILLTTITIIGLFIAPTLQAAVYEFLPDPNDLSDLDHSYFYTWGINWTLPAGETINKATITYVNIYDWTKEPDILYTNLLNTVSDPNGNISLPNWKTKTGYQTITIQQYDGQGSGNNFSGLGILLEPPWTDPNGGPLTKINLSYEIPADYFSWLSDGNFGFGVDPDCHYYNDRVTFEITTSPVPEPTTLYLLGLGLVGLGILGRRKIKK